MSSATTAVLYAPGTNCHEETASAIELAGGKAEVVLLHDLLDGTRRLKDFQAAVIPGGFSYGDHLGAGRVFATLLVARLGERLQEFLTAGKPLLGICNGFQVLSEAGVLPCRSLGRPAMALLENESARFEDRKVRLIVTPLESLWTRGLSGQILEMPSAHGEGRVFSQGADCPGGFRAALRYADAAGNPALSFPENPNGSKDAIAGITDETGLVLGLMPHPERASFPANDSQDGLKIFKNLVDWLEE
ncbi:MAG TPA: phosphoribosylformylglycinamidine synthase I [Terriglobia bacterium]|nr:phosphoribosylformylglycinamidine synthase I [Terriglobia bacterium]